jgi:mannose-6-phosphate isomerase-like protein (cupin superfamily)
MSQAEHPWISSWDERRAYRHERGLKMPYVDERCGAQQLRMHVSVINPGEEPHPPHVHAGEEIFHILEGEAEVLLGAERRTVGPMTSVFCPELVLHGLRNAGSVPLKYMVIRTS